MADLIPTETPKPIFVTELPLNQKPIGDEFWADDIELLWRYDRLMEFFPSKDHTLEERLNSIVRLSLYISLLLWVSERDYKYIYILIGVMGFTYFVYANSDKSKSNIEPLENEKENCTLPTLDNPFMNVTMKDYMNLDKDGNIIDRKPACDISEPGVKEQVDELFNNNLYREVDDIFGKMNSQRQFFTMPYTTIPNKQDEFAKWLYLSPKTCKEDQDYCLKYEDVRQKAPVLYNPEENPTQSRRQEL